MNNFCIFLKNPVYYTKYSKPDIYLFIQLFFFYMVVVVALGILAFITTNIFNITHDKIKLPYLTRVAIIFIFAPFYEELFFRSWLKFNWQNISLIISTLAIFITISLIKGNLYYITLFSIILCLVLVIIFIFHVEVISTFIVKNIKMFYYLTAFIFGVFHATNFTGNPWIILLFSFILGGPQIVAGLILGYIRLRFGLVYSILFHMLINSSVLLAP